jgi:hypothetical protein
VEKDRIQIPNRLGRFTQSVGVHFFTFSPETSFRGVIYILLELL